MNFHLIALLVAVYGSANAMAGLLGYGNMGYGNLGYGNMGYGHNDLGYGGLKVASVKTVATHYPTQVITKVVKTPVVHDVGYGAYSTGYGAYPTHTAVVKKTVVSHAPYGSHY